MKALTDILKTDFGVCSFDSVKDRLLNCRKKAEIPENAQSVILFVFPYKIKEEKPENISRYAAVRDYHPIIEKKLSEYISLLSKEFPHNTFVPFVDNSPFPEVFCASNAGLGVIGKNGLLITEKYGSFVFIGEIATDLLLPATNKAKNCMNCGLCKNACPVGLDKSLCISKITQKKQPLTEEEQKLVIKGKSAWGCDICAEVCPLNKNKALSNIDEFINSYRNSYTEGEDPQNRPYMWRGEAVIKRNSRLLNK